MTARLDLLAHGASEATRAARFPDDEGLEVSAASALQGLSGRIRPYARALIAPARATRETAAALGFDAEVETALRDCDYGRWRGLASNDVAEREPDAFAAWLGDPASAPHGGEFGCGSDRASSGPGSRKNWRAKARRWPSRTPRSFERRLSTRSAPAPRRSRGSMPLRSRLRGSAVTQDAGISWRWGH